MYDAAHSRYGTINNVAYTSASLLPGAATTTVTKNSAYKSLLEQYQLANNHQEEQQKIDTQQLQQNYNEYRPTYGAYINSTLPRGPYLQYKFNDQQLAYSKRNDNNQKNRQIELLKHEFMALPRAKISYGSDPLSIQTNNNHNSLNGVQTLGRHRYTNPSKRTTAQGLSLDYYNKNEIPCERHSYSAINQTIHDTTTELFIPSSSIECVTYKPLSNSNFKYKSNDNFIAKEDYVCNYNQGAGTKNYFNEPMDHCHGRRSLLYRPIQSKKFDMAADLNNYYQKNEPVRQCYTSGSGMGRSVNVANEVSFPINYVTLLEIMNVKQNGFSHIEGWAIFTQSIQALQDLLLAETRPKNRLVPLVNLSNLQITSRGRVVYDLIPAGQLNFDNGVPTFLDASFLSPEYLNSVGRNLSFSDSDIEKMWIYALGSTLHKAITSASGVASTNRTISESLTKINNDRENYDVTIQAAVPSSAIITDMTIYQSDDQNHCSEDDKMSESLDFVISTMCESELTNRSSLMYLLHIISEYCRGYYQKKPFSQIAMDLYQEVIDKASVAQKILSLENKSDTDSGRSSAQFDRDISNHESDTKIKVLEKNELTFSRCSNDEYRFFDTKSMVSEKNQPKVSRYINDEYRPAVMKSKVSEKNELKVSRNSTNEYRPFYSDMPFNNCKRIGYSIKTEMEDKPLDSLKRLQVTRRRDEILKKRNQSRRSTIAVNLLDMEKGINCDGNINLDGSNSKSTNCLDKIGIIEDVCHLNKNNEPQSNRCSMPELNDVKFSTLPNLKIRRVKEAVNVNVNEDLKHLAIIKSKGPEFIANSSLSPRTIDITDSKCQHHKRAVIVLLLNGKSINISCNSATATAQEIFETVVKCEHFAENFFLGICALIGGDFVFLPPDLKIHKVAPEIWFNVPKKGCFAENVIFTLFLRTKFFLPTLRGINSSESRHLLYLQLRKSILESHILCNDDELITLGGLAIQSEIGDFTEAMKHTDYFTISHYLPEGVYQRNNAMAKYLRNSHYSKIGLHNREAEYNFIRYVQEMKEYGLHLFSAVWNTDDGLTYDVYVAISLSGIRIFRRSSTSRQDQQIENSKHSKIEFQRKLYADFEWLEIENLCFSKHMLCVVIRKPESLKPKDNNRVKYKFRMDGRKSYFAFHLASEHHRFYMKLRNSFTSLKLLSDELNLPLDTVSASNSNEARVDQIRAEDQLNCVAVEQPNLLQSSNKPDKSTESRVGKIKKSMLNDNRLLKLKNKFLKRSKSSVGLRERICSNPNGQSKEENQNKENECPKVETKSHNLLLSPSRNRVKMGTRVFGSQFLNKSFDNVIDGGSSSMCKFDADNDLNNESCRGKHCGYGRDEKDCLDDGISLRSSSLSSLYYSEKMTEKFPKTVSTSEAYVIQSSIKSNSDVNHFAMFNETVSDSLLDKFNNLSKNNTIGDRVITHITIVKDKIKSSDNVQLVGEKFSLESDGCTSVEDDNSAKLTLGISIVQGSDNNVYVKSLVENGPGHRKGVQVGDQILAVNGNCLLNLSYNESLKILQNTGKTLELTVSQIYKKPMTTMPMASTSHGTKTSKSVRSITQSIKKSFKFKKDGKDIENTKVNAVGINTTTAADSIENVTKCDTAHWHRKIGYDKSTRNEIVRSMPDLPKVVGIIAKHQTNEKGTLPRTMGLSRKYVGPVRYPVTPIRPTTSVEKQRLSLLADNVEKQVFI